VLDEFDESVSGQRVSIDGGPIDVVVPNLAAAPGVAMNCVTEERRPTGLPTGVVPLELSQRNRA
jgi:hypothetical protein